MFWGLPLLPSHSAFVLLPIAMPPCLSLDSALKYPQNFKIIDTTVTRNHNEGPTKEYLSCPKPNQTKHQRYYSNGYIVS